MHSPANGWPTGKYLTNIDVPTIAIQWARTCACMRNICSIMLMLYLHSELLHVHAKHLLYAALFASICIAGYQVRFSFCLIAVSWVSLSEELRTQTKQIRLPWQDHFHVKLPTEGRAHAQLYAV